MYVGYRDGKAILVCFTNVLFHKNSISDTFKHYDPFGKAQLGHMNVWAGQALPPNVFLQGYTLTFKLPRGAEGFCSPFSMQSVKQYI